MNTPTIHVQYLKTAKLIPSESNARIHSNQQLAQLTKCIQEVGFINPIIIDANNRVIAGHARLEIAKELNYETVPVICADFLTEMQIRAYAIADNKLCEQGEWDQNLLRVELEFLSQAEIDLDIEMTGFQLPEIDLLLQSQDQSDFDEPDLPASNPCEENIVQPGDIWDLGSHSIGCGDTRDPEFVNSLINGHQAHMVFTDPPYNVPVSGHVSGNGKHQHPEFAMASGEMSEDEFTQFLENYMSVLKPHCTPGAVWFTCMDWRHIDNLYQAIELSGGSLLNLIVWNKTSGGMGSLYRSQHELITVSKMDNTPHINNVQLGKHGRNRTNVWTYPGMNAFGSERDEALKTHPTVKPVAMIAEAIMDVTHRHHIVIDGFLGSGSTLLAAEQTGRHCIGIEIETRYVALSIKRWQDYTGKEAIHRASGLTFNELSKQHASETSKEYDHVQA